MTAPEENAVKQLKFPIVTPLLLAVSRGDFYLAIYTDVCDSQTGYILLQKRQDKTARPMGY